MISGIYKIHNTANGKRYIGSAVNLVRRWALHRNQLTKGTHHSCALQRAWNRYGAGAFEFIVLLGCARDELIIQEQLALDVLKPEYNICKTAGNTLGFKFSDEARQKLSAARKRRVTDPGTGPKISAALRGRKATTETRLKIGRANKGKVRTPEMCNAMAARLRGKPLSAETRARMAAAHTGLRHSPEHCAAIAAAHARRRISG